MSKKLLGYRIKDEFLAATRSVLGRSNLYNRHFIITNDGPTNYTLIYTLSVNKHKPLIDTLSKLQVLDTWTEPVYSRNDDASTEKHVLKENTWYIHKSKGDIVFHIGYGKAFGVSAETSNWVTDINLGNGTHTLFAWREATHQEVYNLLMNEAEKRGLVVGDHIKSKDKSETLRIEELDYHRGKLFAVTRYGDKRAYIELLSFENGEWMEPVKVPKFKLKPNTWYINKTTGTCAFHRVDNKGFARRRIAKWVESFHFNPQVRANRWREATPDEIKDMLEKELTERKLVPGSYWEYHVVDGPTDGPIIDVGFYPSNYPDTPLFPFAIIHEEGTDEKNQLLLLSTYGKWEEIPEVTLPTINGYKGEFTDNGDIKYGCAILNKEWFKKSVNRNITQITLSSGVTINREQMGQIRKCLINKGVKNLKKNKI